MVDPRTLAARIARARTLLIAARETRGIARNLRNVAVLRRALDNLERQASPLSLRAPRGSLASN